MLEQVSIDELKQGMYVTQVLEQSGTLHMRSEGVVKSQSIVDALKKKGILLLEVDMAKSKHHLVKDHLVKENEPDNSVANESVESAAAKPKPLNNASINEANDLYEDALSIQSKFIKALNQETVTDLSPMTSLSQSLIESVFDNGDALSCLTLIKDTDNYLLEHSINCSVLTGIFCKFIGYDRDSIEQASLGALLMDTGMSSIPADIRRPTAALSEDDIAVLRTHVEIGANLVEQCGDIPDLSLQVIEQHQERIDGSGYPRGLSNDDISEFARIAAIVDTYDELTSHHPSQASLTPMQALKRLSGSAGLDQSLVRQFIQCIGVHPVGSLVKLKSGKLGIVSKINPKDPINPHVMTFYSVTSNHFNEIKKIDLSLYNDEVISGVRPEEFRINLPKFFKEVFVRQAPQ
ncbi:HD-GYP domain-containing protein [Alteromonas genovensis]|uniref:HD-GYP domain-containing protein n=1 Tax=Alteromonas genovensis TaxID=471225 RepID=UPI002FE2C0DD